MDRITGEYVYRILYMEPERIKAAIREAGHTYQSLAEEIGVTTSAISEVVHGRSRGAGLRYAIASVIGRSVEELWPSDQETRAATA